MTETTPLDLAHAAMEAAPDDDGARLRFYHRLADTELFVLLTEEPDGDTIAPQVFPLEEGSFVAAFDLEERLAAFSGAPVPYAALPGRVIAAELAGQGVGIALNLAVAPSGQLLPAAAVDWLAATLGHGPGRAEARPMAFAAPGDLPPALVTEIEAKLAALGGLAAAAGLAAARWADGRHGHLFAFVGAAPGAEPGLAKAVSEALSFSGIEAGELDVTFLPAEGEAARAFLSVARLFALPQPPEPGAEPSAAAKGNEPAEPPIPNLRGYRQRDA